MKRILISPNAEVEIEFDPAALPMHRIQDGTTLVRKDGRIHRITHAGGRLLVNGKEVELSLADPRDRRRNGNNSANSGRKDVRAAMPGKVIKLLAGVGDTVSVGDGLLILEAMKMQNEVRAPGEGRLTAVRVAVGDTVASGQVLVTLE